jgi:hypothetical protein
MLLAISVKPSDPLMHAHGIPGNIDMHQGMALLLKVDPFTGRLGRDKEAELPIVERIGLISPACLQDLQIAGPIPHALKAIIPIDEACDVVAIDLIQG